MTIGTFAGARSIYKIFTIDGDIITDITRNEKQD